MPCAMLQTMDVTFSASLTKQSRYSYTTSTKFILKHLASGASGIKLRYDRMAYIT